MGRRDRRLGLREPSVRWGRVAARGARRPPARTHPPTLALRSCSASESLEVEERKAEFVLSRRWKMESSPALSFLAPPPPAAPSAAPAAGRFSLPPDCCCCLLLLMPAALLRGAAARLAQAMRRCSAGGCVCPAPCRACTHTRSLSGGVRGAATVRVRQAAGVPVVAKSKTPHLTSPACYSPPAAPAAAAPPPPPTHRTRGAARAGQRVACRSGTGTPGSSSSVQPSCLARCGRQRRNEWGASSRAASLIARLHSPPPPPPPAGRWQGQAAKGARVGGGGGAQGRRWLGASGGLRCSLAPRLPRSLSPSRAEAQVGAQGLRRVRH